MGSNREKFNIAIAILELPISPFKQGFGSVTFYLADPDPPENAQKAKYEKRKNFQQLFL